MICASRIALPFGLVWRATGGLHTLDVMREGGGGCGTTKGRVAWIIVDDTEEKTKGKLGKSSAPMERCASAKARVSHPARRRG
jgi:hypothetical protein